MFHFNHKIAHSQITTGIPIWCFVVLFVYKLAGEHELSAMNEVSPGLWITNVDSASNMDALRKLQVTHLIDLRSETNGDTTIPPNCCYHKAPEEFRG